MKDFSCPICKKQIVLSELEQSFIDSYNAAYSMLGRGSFFSGRGSGIRRVCKSCKSNLYFDWKSQSFIQLNWLQEFINLFTTSGYKRILPNKKE